MLRARGLQLKGVVRNGNTTGIFDNRRAADFGRRYSAWPLAPVVLMYLAAVAVGLGYLYTTGTVDEIGKKAVTYVGTPPVPAPAPALSRRPPRLQKPRRHPRLSLLRHPRLKQLPHRHPKPHPLRLKRRRLKLRHRPRRRNKTI